ncbi:sarcosine oxidase subunit gamma [Cobetia sp. L2A1]|uniref:sarcosine oxidase subunit gamma n=1 Tax=Cobetia sp. L2A1 TaxID=2686360 RepID=UPI00131B7888|nr:sarcosine oxidase subunit gamma family protein [Cobetia sp. L2A1]
MSDAITLDPQASAAQHGAAQDVSSSQTSVIDQRPTLDVHAKTARSPLAHLFTARADSEAGVVLEEKAFLGHLTLRGDPAQAGFAEAVETALGVALPLSPSTLNLNDAGVSVQWLAPDEWLIIVPGDEAFAFEKALHEQLCGRYQVVNVSGGQTVVSLSGAEARQVLMKSTPTDVHPRAFPVGRGVPAVFAKATLILRRTSEDEFELVIRRSFADYLGRWLLDASEEFGVCIKA